MTLALVAVPVVHWVTFWPAPFVGGYLAGLRTKAAGGDVFLIGLIMGLLMVAPVAGFVALASFMFLDLTVSSIAIFAGVLTLYVAGLSCLGAVAGGSSARRQVSA